MVGKPIDVDDANINAAPCIDFGFSAMMTNRTTAAAQNALTNETDLNPRMLRLTCKCVLDILRN